MSYRRPRFASGILLFALCFAVTPGVAYAVLWPQPVQLHASEWDKSYCGFGYAVAAWGDEVAASVPGESVSGYSNAGKVCVFRRRWPGWQKVQELSALVPSSDAYVGEILAMHGDLLVAAAPREDSSQGAVHVFIRSGGAWTYDARISRPSPTAVGFGLSVSAYGDKVVVGAPLANGTRGAAFVYQRTGPSAWTLVQQIDDPMTTNGDSFGGAVALYDDWLAVGAPGTLVSGTIAGAVHLYRWNPATSRYDLSQSILAPDVENVANFGLAVALERGHLVVGAPGMPYHSVSWHGLGYLFSRSGSTWSLVARLTSASSLGSAAQLGSSVAISGETIALGAPLGGAGKGAVLLYSMSALPNAILQQQCTVNGPDSLSADARFGKGLGLSGGNLACGAPLDDTSTLTNSGMLVAYAFRYPLWPDCYALRVSGADRYLTNIEASKRGFPFGAPAVVVCTGENWPDALGGAGLAGAVHGPVLLTRASALPTSTAAEIERLGAVKAYVLGGTGVVSASVENTLRSLLGSSNVRRLYGANRYATAQAVAAETIRLRGGTYLGGAFVATGDRYPDAVAVSPLAAYVGTPLLLSNPASSTVDLPPEVTTVVVAGGEGAVSAAQFSYLQAELGVSNVARVFGTDRYATAAALAQLGADIGMNKSGVGLATGENFPDALSAGPMLGAYGCPLLLTRSATLSPATDAKLRAWRPAVSFLHVIGGTGAVSDAVKNAAADAAWGP